jgi:hypothetical protein
MSEKMLTELRLSANGMANISPLKSEQDFTFIVGDNAYKCPWFVADFLSPWIGRLHAVDPSISELVIETEDPGHQFEAFLCLGQGVPLVVNDANQRFFALLSLELGNYEAYFSLHGLLHGDRVLSELCKLFAVSDFRDSFPDAAIEFLASHFVELDSHLLLSLPISSLSRILCHPSLTLGSEDSLYEFVSSRFETEPDSVGLLEFVRFEFLSKSAIDQFVVWSCDHFDEFDFTLSLWQRITKRLSQSPALPMGKTARSTKSLIVPSDVHSPLNGIIAHLSRTHGGNVHDRGIVHVSSSSVTASYVAKNAVDLDQSNAFDSEYAPNQWLCYDFKDRRIELAAYSIAAYASYFLRSWVVEGSEDGSTWATLDERSGNTDADSDHPIATFTVESQARRSRFIRLRQTGKCADGTDYLVIQGFELFGRLIELISE